MKVLNVNLTGTFRTCMAFRALLADSRGSVVNIASMNATLALPRKGIIDTTKVVRVAIAVFLPRNTTVPICNAASSKPIQSSGVNIYHRTLSWHSSSVMRTPIALAPISNREGAAP